ncbi:hypothetical protein DV738_g4306, partial [Chaetothyriales sp. CBS 135597]
MANPSQLLLIADHIKLSLLERQRAISLNLDLNRSQEASIARSLESLREGIEAISASSSIETDDVVSNLRLQYHDLSRQFHGESSATAEATLTSPNNPALEDDFAHARSRNSQDGRPQAHRHSSLRGKDSLAASNKNVRFRDDPSQDSLDEQDETNRALLFQQPYTDNQDQADAPDPTAQMTNQQIHTYHQQVLMEQDNQLDSLSESIGRQRHLAMQVGDELEGQIALLDELDRGVDRHQSRLDGAKRRLKGVSETAKANWGMTTIIILIVILVFLIVVLK